MNFKESIYQNIELIRGDDEDIDVVVSDSNGEAVDLEDVEIRFTVREDFDDEEAVIELSSEDDAITIVDPEAGTFIIHIATEITSELEIRNYVYDIEVVIDGKKKTIASGVVSVYADVTREAEAEP